jgi:hypothetical protein
LVVIEDDKIIKSNCQLVAFGSEHRVLGKSYPMTASRSPECSSWAHIASSGKPGPQQQLTLVFVIRQDTGDKRKSVPCVVQREPPGAASEKAGPMLWLLDVKFAMRPGLIRCSTKYGVGSL